MRYRALLFASLILLAGCGGGGSGPASTPLGKAVFTVTWPDAARLVPVAANSVRITLTGGSFTVSQVLTRPATGNTATATFDAVPVGQLLATAAAFPTTDGTGTPQAFASLPITVEPNVIAHADLTMASTIDHLEITPPVATLTAGDNLQLIMAARDRNGAVVFTSPSTIQWVSSAPGVASTDANGGITALTMGDAPITVTETESGKSATAPITVKLRIQISPVTVQVPVGGSQLFSARVTGASNTGVTWSVQEGSVGGSISPSGQYVAPPARGTFHVVATSAADPTQQAVATVTVQSGTGQVVIQ